MWQALWTEAIYDLRLTEAQFWSMTPRQLVWLRKRHQQEMERQELLMAIQTSTLANHSMAAPKRPYKPYDFMPSQICKRKSAQVLDDGQKWSREGFANQMLKMRDNMMRGANKGLFVNKGDEKKPIYISEHELKR